jgi:hypothetical protein
MTKDPGLYVGATGFLRVMNKAYTGKPIWIPVYVEPKINFGRMDFIVRPVYGTGWQLAYKHRVWFEDPELNYCKDAPNPEELKAYKDKIRTKAGFIVEEDDDAQA